MRPVSASRSLPLLAPGELDERPDRIGVLPPSAAMQKASLCRTVAASFSTGSDVTFQSNPSISRNVGTGRRLWMNMPAPPRMKRS